jgi:hypothetical protein
MMHDGRWTLQHTLLDKRVSWFTLYVRSLLEHFRYYIPENSMDALATIIEHLLS